MAEELLVGGFSTQTKAMRMRAAALASDTAEEFLELIQDLIEPAESSPMEDQQQQHHQEEEDEAAEIAELDLFWSRLMERPDEFDYYPPFDSTKSAVPMEGVQAWAEEDRELFDEFINIFSDVEEGDTAAMEDDGEDAWAEDEDDFLDDGFIQDIAGGGGHAGVVAPPLDLELRL
uniref:Uncharacterized protein n=1 Tax=Setaria viridis TaxID=4556 RepID=A0A4U6UCG9_SETVI|nr:hypothetical protein SEVIR_5G106700v2 [Setaria viridis]